MAQSEYDPLKISHGILKEARAVGKLNLSNRAMIRIPDDVFTMYDSQKVAPDMSFDSEPAENWWDALPLTRLILADNEISSIDTRIDMYTTLTYLDIRNNNLSELPEVIGELIKLQFLSIAGNQLTSLPDCVFSLPINDLQVQRNKLGSLPDCIENLAPTLTSLDLSNNALSHLPDSTIALKNLAHLNVSDNRLTSLPEHFNDISKLKELDVARNRLTSLFVPSAATNGNTPIVFKVLTRIDATENQLTEIAPSSVAVHLPQLKDLLLGKNRLDKIDKVLFESMPHLMTLDLHENHLEGNLEGLGTLGELLRLDISCNLYRSLPIEIGYLNQLQSINIENNPLRRRPQGKSASDLVKWLGQQIDTLNINSQLEGQGDSDDARIPLGNLAIPASSLLPSRFDSFQINSGTLKLDRHEQYNKLEQASITDIDNATKELPFVAKILSLQHNSIMAPPLTLISALSATLTTIDLSHNQLTTIPFTGPSDKGLVLPNLKSLNIAHNRIIAFPESSASDTTYQLGHALPALNDLDLSYNALSQLPESPIRDVLGTKSLINVFLTKNNITTIVPKTFEGLKIVNLSDNEIRQIPFELGLIESIEGLELMGNRFRVPRYDILSKGTATVMEWLRGRIAN